MKEVKGYCVKCKDKDGVKKRRINKPEVVTMKNGRKAVRGTCDCGTGMYSILSADQAKELEG